MRKATLTLNLTPRGERAGTTKQDIERQLREIARDRRYWEQKRDKIRQAEKRVDELSEKYQSELDKSMKILRVVLNGRLEILNRFGRIAHFFVGKSLHKERFGTTRIDFKGLVDIAEGAVVLFKVKLQFAQCRDIAGPATGETT